MKEYFNRNKENLHPQSRIENDLGYYTNLITALSPSWTSADREEYGVCEVDIDPPENYYWTGEVEGEFPNFTPVYEELPYPTEDDVIDERRRRLSVGFDYDFGDERGVHRIGTTENDMIGWDEVMKWAQAKMILGDTTATKLIVTDTSPVTITPLEWCSIIEEADSFRGPIWEKSFILQAMNPIPRDYKDNKYWE